MNTDRFKNTILDIDEHNFNDLSLEIFQYQVKTNQIYQKYVDYLNIVPNQIKHFNDIPFLPISFFKEHEIISGRKPEEAELIFESSSTTGKGTSKHYLFDSEFYNKIAGKGFEAFYGPIEDYCILALLPGYLERNNSSLVFMANNFIQKSKYSSSDFYLNQFEKLHQQILFNEENQIPTLLLGVSFALLDFAEQFPIQLKHTKIMETGGMKGKRKEMIRTELHQIFKEAFNIEQVNSEYGMTELMSQAYSKQNGLFHCPPWMKVIIRETSDPFSIQNNGKTGGINIIDLANIDSCSFIATSDLGKLYDNGCFEVLGRFDQSDVRGCNLLYA